MTVTLGFDVYGTLIDTHGVIVQLESMIGERAAAFSNTWRDKQLEYMFRRGLMREYENFPTCTRDALEYTCSFYAVELSKSQKQHLLEGYLSLPSFTDVEQGLSVLKTKGTRMFAFSNGVPDALETLLNNAGIRGYFQGVVSVDDIKTFKPNPDVYKYFLEVTGSQASQAWLVSSNGFDVIGAISAGMNAAWVQRSDKVVFDPWGIESTITVTSLIDLADQLVES